MGEDISFIDSTADLLELFSTKMFDDYKIIEFKLNVSPKSLIDVKSLIICTNLNILQTNYDIISNLNKFKIFHFLKQEDIIWSKEELNIKNICAFYEK